MHELSLTENAARIVNTYAAREGARRVVRVHFVVGGLVSADPDCVQFAWQTLTAGTPAEGAELVFRQVPMAFECRDCRASFTPAGTSFVCTACGSTRVRVAGGDEFYVEAIDIETTDVTASAAPASGQEASV